MFASAISKIRKVPGRWARRIVIVATVLVVGLAAGGYAIAKGSSGSTEFPQSAAIEAQYGVRFSRIAVVGDGGLVTLTYVVLDSERATRFQSDVQHPPELRSEKRDGGTKRVSVMKQGHTLRAGQTYYLVYQNTKGALQHSAKATILVGSLSLQHAPVL
ncbi:hypothetical protein [Kribbella monticola]|uniref:hypothetical protein n=1 Tax=Kribbella monticola TaxID=2185285 RepID=UPI000DD2B945|nr:hypothetical protein [Kribbella monticola]